MTANENAAALAGARGAGSSTRDESSNTKSSTDVATVNALAGIVGIECEGVTGGFFRNLKAGTRNAPTRSTRLDVTGEHRQILAAFTRNRPPCRCSMCRQEIDGTLMRVASRTKWGNFAYRDYCEFCVRGVRVNGHAVNACATERCAFRACSREITYLHVYSGVPAYFCRITHFCCDTHRRWTWHGAPKRAIVACASCGVEFPQRRADAKFCSYACRQKAYRKRIARPEAV